MTGPPSSDDLFRPHFRAGRFYCPWGLPRRSPLDVVRWQSRRAPARERRVSGPTAAPSDGALLARFAERPTLHWIGHASSLLHEGDVLVAVDPHFGPLALLPRRQRPPGLPVEAIRAARLGLISHNHYDHLDAWTLRRLPRSMTWLVPLGLRGTISKFGFAEVRELDWWQAVEVAGWRFRLLPAQHWSRRLGQPENSTLWGSWLVETPTARVFFAGDTGYFHGFAEYGRRFGSFNAAVLPIGAYEPRWFMSPVHMSPGEALRATRELGARHLLPVHWGTFDLSDEGVDEPPRELLRQLAKEENADLRDAVRVLPTGGSLEL